MELQMTLVFFLLLTSPLVTVVHAYDDDCNCDCHAEDYSDLYGIVGATIASFVAPSIANGLGFGKKGTVKNSYGSRLTSFADRTGIGKDVVNTMKSQGAGGKKHQQAVADLGFGAAKMAAERFIGNGNRCDCCLNRR